MNLTKTISSVDVNLKAIETKGFVVIRNFLSPDEIDFIVNDFHESKRRARNANYPISYADATVINLLRDKIMDVSDAVDAATSTSVNADQGAIYFSLSRGINFGWHQDHESYYMNQNHIDYLNFYMIVIKEKAEEANLNVIPFDRLKTRSPEIYKKIIGGGAARYEIRNGETEILSDETGKTIGTLPYDIGILADTPHLRAGDLLLLRGDVIHSTQASDSARVALSVRMVNSRNRVSLKRMVRGGKAKTGMMTNNRQIYAKIFNAFKKLNLVESSYQELVTLINLDNSPMPSKASFSFRLFMLRLQFMFG